MALRVVVLLNSTKDYGQFTPFFGKINHEQAGANSADTSLKLVGT